MSLASFSLILGVLGYLYGFPLIFSDVKHLHWRRGLVKDENVVRMIGTLFVMASIVTLRQHARLVPGAEGVVVLAAWLVLIKGLYVAWFPRVHIRLHAEMSRVLYGSDASEMFVGFCAVLLGALFTYIGVTLP